MATIKPKIAFIGGQIAFSEMQSNIATDPKVK
jgi:hypothetical protein